jgi:hypothetical protein
MLDLNYFLVNNIDLSSITNWTPLGTFTGELDGKGYNIYNLNIVGNVNESRLGLFKVVNNSEIKNLNLINPNIKIVYNTTISLLDFGFLSGLSVASTFSNIKILETSNSASRIVVEKTGSSSNHPINLGGLIGRSSGTLQINNIKVDTNISGQSRTGGIVGATADSGNVTITNSIFIGNILEDDNITGFSRVGGLIGENSGTGVVTISNSKVISNLELEKTSEVGGLIGFTMDKQVIIEKSAFIGEMKVSIDSGKLIGRIWTIITNSSISNSYAIGSIESVVDTIRLGALIGFGRLNGTTFNISSVYVDGNVIGGPSKNTGGILIGTNGDGNGTGFGRYNMQNVYYNDNGDDNSGNLIAIGSNSAATISNTNFKSVEDLKNPTSYTTWTNFNTIWRINPDINNGYPYLAWEE